MTFPKSFILGKCCCGCNEDIPVINTGNFLQRFKKFHHNKGKFNPFYGKKFNSDVIKKMRQNNSGDKNPNHGKTHSAEIREIIRQSKIAGKNPMWKGDDVGYSALHDRMRRQIKQPDYCEQCEKKTKRLDLANISGNYLPIIQDWEYLCRKCHTLKDGRHDWISEFNK